FEFQSSFGCVCWGKIGQPVSLRSAVIRHSLFSGMIAFIVRRFLSLVFVLFCVVTITFFLIRLAPGGPFDRERKIPPQIEKQLLEKYKLDGPLMQQYGDYLNDLRKGDLRLSSKYRSRTVNEILAQTLPVSF